MEVTVNGTKYDGHELYGQNNGTVNRTIGEEIGEEDGNIDWSSVEGLTD